ncbi:MAG: glycosyltransferase family 39 protein [Schleiferiaceae bacterium]|nr:glycosyltransferase family 39 protein [Schleiferiaceae bacterium]
MNFENYLPVLKTWILPMVILLGINVAFLSPAYFGGDVLDQDDIKLGYAKSKEIRDYRAETGEEPLWTNAMFSGMPATQISTKYDGNIFQYLTDVVRAIGGTNSSTYIIFYLMIAAFIGLRGMGVNHWLSTIGGFAYGYSGFFIIGYAAGHNAKVNTAAFIPLMILALLLVFEKKNWRAFILMAVFAGLSIHRNHFQITYYAGIFMAIIWVVYLIQYAKEKALPTFAKYTGLVALAGVLAIGPNIANIWSTKVYTSESMRGGKSELTQKNQNQGEGGLSYDYAMSWSTGIYETVALVIPNAAGGGMMVDYSKKGTETYDQLVQAFRGQGMNAKQAEQQANQYMGAAFMRWTGESMGNGAYYVGAAIFFLFCLAFFVVGGATRQWIIASSIFFVFMSWGSNFNAFNTFLFNYLPLYNKFRVPSMALTIVFFIVPFYGILGLNQWYTLDKKARFDALKKGALAFTGFVALFGLIAPFVMDLETARDAQFAQQGFRIDQLVGDRRSLATSSALASLGFGLLTAAALYFFHIGKLKLLSSAALIGGIALLDLGLFTTDQIEREDFLSQRQWEAQYAPTAANQAINQDSDPHFRVWNATVGLTNDSYTSYHHKSVGGYHGAKLQRYQDLIDNQLNNQNIACFSMLNAKYIITQGGQNGQPQAQRNPDACGNAWSVQNIQLVPNADAEMAALTAFNPKSTAIIDTRYSDYLGGKTTYAPAKARLTSYDPKHLEYSVEGGDAFIVFSELFYEGAGNDWQAYLDGVPVAHIRVNYLLRGLTVPAGKHEVVFEYAPKSHYTGQKINYAGSGIILLLLFWMGFKQVRERTNG